MDSKFKKIETHYAGQTVELEKLGDLVEIAKKHDALSPRDLTAIDEFHIGGRKATLELAGKLDLKSGMTVLDVGCGLGGAARCLAAEFGCQVTGLDLSKKYCEAAGMLSRRLGLGSQVCYRHGNAIDMPFAEAAFDVLWIQHVTMNIPDKAALFSELRRVLKPGGILASYEILAGAGGAVYFPVPWASEPAISFMQTPAHLRDLLGTIGFELLSWQDKTESACKWFQRMDEKMEKQPVRPLGLHLLLGPEFRTMAKNQVRNLEEKRITLIEFIARRPTTDI